VQNCDQAPTNVISHYQQFSLSVTVDLSDFDCGQQGVKLSAGAIAGVAIGCILAAVLAGFAVVWISKLKESRLTSRLNENLKKGQMAEMSNLNYTKI
jgi:hypothetical protein